MRTRRFLLFTLLMIASAISTLAQPGVDLSSGVPSQAQGWVLLTDETATHLASTDQYNYLYVRSGRWYMTPQTNLLWNWTQGQQLIGTYTYFDGTNISTLYCEGSDELPHVGVGCSNGPGGTAKVYTTDPFDPVNAQVTVCQDSPDIFQVGACGVATAYVRTADIPGVDTHPPIITFSGLSNGAVLSRGSTVTINYTCSDSESGLASCNGPIPSGSLLDTTQYGTYRFIVTATDNAGNFNMQVLLYTIAPIADPGWTLVTDQPASQISSTAIKQYLYLAGGGSNPGWPVGLAGTWYVSPPTNLVWNWNQGQQLVGTYSYFDGTNGGNVYCTGSDEQPPWGVGCSSGPGGTAKVLTIYDNDPVDGQGVVCQDIPNIFQVGACGWATFYVWQSPQQAVSATPTGSGVTVEPGVTTLTFSSVTASGTTTVQQVDPSTAGEIPGGFAISNIEAFEISTTATFSGSVTVGFLVPAPISETDFDNLRILHNDNGNLVDITSSYDYANLTIYGISNSFSPFYLARRGPHIAPLFDQTNAYKSGSTIPIKLQVLDAANTNTSSSSLVVQARGLLRLKDSTEFNVTDAGNSNPDFDFRYDSTIGGTGGYIFNLSTKGLVSGNYSLSMYVGNDKQYVYSVTFDLW